MTPVNVNKRIKEDPGEGEARTSPSEKRRGRKRRKRSGAAADKNDALFDDVNGRKIVRSALELAPAPAPVEVEEINVDSALKPGRGQQGDQSLGHGHAELRLLLTRLRSRLVLWTRRGASDAWVQPEDDLSWAMWVAAVVVELLKNIGNVCFVH